MNLPVITSENEVVLSNSVVMSNSNDFLFHSYKESNHKNLNSTYDLLFIGSGISSSFTLLHLLDEIDFANIQNKVKINIAVIERIDEFWKGIPYGKRSGENSLIITCLKDFLPENQLEDFCSWITKNWSKLLLEANFKGFNVASWLENNDEAIKNNDWEEIFIPRNFYGIYIADIIERKLKKQAYKGDIKVDLFVGEVIDVEKQQDIFSIYVANSQSKKFASNGIKATSISSKRVVLTVGSPPNRKLASTKKTQNKNINTFSDLYFPDIKNNIKNIREKLQELPEKSEILVLGSNASAIECIYLLTNDESIRDLISKFIVISPSAKFPSLIESTVSGDSYEPKNLKKIIKNSFLLSAKEIYEAVKKDTEHAEALGETSSTIYKVMSSSVIEALGKLSFDEKKEFVTNYGNKIGKYQRRAGSDYLSVIGSLEDDCKLEYLKGRFVDLLTDSDGMSTVSYTQNHNNSNLSSIKKYKSRISFCIDCTGFQSISKTSSQLLRNLVANKLCKINRSDLGFELNETFEASDGLYVMGPLIAGNINAEYKVWHAESCIRIHDMSKKLAKIIGKKIQEDKEMNIITVASAL